MRGIAKVTETVRSFLLKQDEVVFAYLHGSFIGEGPFKDVDVAVYVNSKVHIFYKKELEEELSREVNLPVDVRVLNNAPVTSRFRAIGSCSSSAGMKKPGVTLRR